jgi:acetyl esterase/lipase
LFWAAYYYGSDPVELKKLSELYPRDADPSLWDKPLTIITCEYDSLEEEGAQFAHKLKAAGKDVVLMQTKGTAHGWDIFVGDNEDEWTHEVKGGVAKKEAYELAVKRLKEALQA